MSVHGRIDRADFTVLLDVRAPTAYLALHPAIALGDRLGIDVNWLPRSVPPLAPPSEPAPGDDRGACHRRHRARAIAREIETYASVQGLLLRDIHRAPDATPFNLGWLWVRERHPTRLEAYLVEGFRAYWALELDPADLTAVTALVARTGADGTGFGPWVATDGARITEEIDTDVSARGLFGVPGYVVDGEYFLGRQHLPMIEWILGGRRGSGPI